MSQLRDVLPRYFILSGEPDNLPFAVRSKAGTETGRHQLGRMMRELGFRTGIEIGTLNGVSAEMWCDTIPGLDLTCIDPYTGREGLSEAYRKAKASAAATGYTLLRMSSMDAVDRFEPGSVDFVHIDGNHKFDGCVQDIVRYVPKVRQGGLVLIHDYHAFRLAGVREAVDAYTHCHRIDPWYVIGDHQPTVFWERGAEHA